jgi:hypothetical protein
MTRQTPAVDTLCHSTKARIHHYCATHSTLKLGSAIFEDVMDNVDYKVYNSGAKLYLLGNRYSFDIFKDVFERIYAILATNWVLWEDAHIVWRENMQLNKCRSINEQPVSPLSGPFSLWLIMYEMYSVGNNLHVLGQCKLWNSHFVCLHLLGCDWWICRAHEKKRIHVQSNWPNLLEVDTLCSTSCRWAHLILGECCRSVPWRR